MAEERAKADAERRAIEEKAAAASRAAEEVAREAQAEIDRLKREAAESERISQEKAKAADEKRVVTCPFCNKEFSIPG
jgi:hypothetical protein